MSRFPDVTSFNPSDFPGPEETPNIPMANWSDLTALDRISDSNGNVLLNLENETIRSLENDDLNYKLTDAIYNAYFQLARGEDVLENLPTRERRYFIENKFVAPMHPPTFTQNIFEPLDSFLDIYHSVHHTYEQYESTQLVKIREALLAHANFWFPIMPEDYNNISLEIDVERNMRKFEGFVNPLDRRLWVFEPSSFTRVFLANDDGDCLHLPVRMPACFRSFGSESTDIYFRTSGLPQEGLLYDASLLLQYSLADIFRKANQRKNVIHLNFEMMRRTSYGGVFISHLIPELNQATGFFRHKGKNPGEINVENALQRLSILMNLAISNPDTIQRIKGTRTNSAPKPKPFQPSLF